MIFEKLANSLKDSPEFTTFPKTFENYSWKKPLIVGIVGLIIYLILNIIMLFIAIFIPGSGGVTGLIAVVTGGYDSLNAYSVAGLVSIVSIVLFIPSLYVASKIVHDRPFSSYGTSRKGWNWNIFFKSVAVAIVIFILVTIIQIFFEGSSFNNKFTIITLLICTITIPLQCIAEEYILRGYIMQTIGSWFGIPILAIIVQAIVFASLHPYNITGVIATLITGLCFGILTYYTKGLEMSSAIHVVNNLFAFYASGLGIIKITSNISMISFIVDLIAIIVPTILLLYLSNRYEWFKE